MIVSWNWLKDFVPLEMPPEEAARRLAMSGLNHESTEAVGNDLAIDLEVTSNRTDCLGHIGIAREISVLWQTPLVIPQPAPQDRGPAIDTLTSVRIDCPELCWRYTARLLQQVKIGPSPKWLADRLTTLGIATINNVVDITNYVMMECGQPLHAFDLQQLHGKRIIVREAHPHEPFTAIDHRTYHLQPGMCVIADADRPVALGGVMGGADTEITEQTTCVLLEAAEFAPLSIRSTARALRLHSPSSYRFERGLDRSTMDWASLRACQLIQDLAGGQLASGVIDQTSSPTPSPTPITLRLSQLERILGITIDRDEVRRIVLALGNCETPQRDKANDCDSITVIPPSWRRDLSREIDLIEEVARIHGYDQIPEDVGVPMAPSYQTPQERVLRTTRETLVACGFYEALTPSLVEAELASAFTPWSDQPSLTVSMPMLRGADHLRKCLVPSLLRARQINESLGNDDAELFETAKIYLPRPGQLPDEPTVVALVSGQSYRHVKGVIESLVDSLHRGLEVEVMPFEDQFFAAGQAMHLQLAGRTCGYLGVIDTASQRKFQLRQGAVVAELNLAELVAAAKMIPQHETISPFPAVRYDLNMVVDERVRWSDLARTVRNAASDVLECLEYSETYRDPAKDGRGKKRLLFSLQLRSPRRTLTGDEADQIRRAVIEACQTEHQATLLA